ncbi:MAG: TetR/AcrR family transcriptional regulator [Alphaproteobacteria bacterium]|nr:TetR/AcrR family transcriptional regulator [Alphaproteobacteria bacterium]
MPDPSPDSAARRTRILDAAVRVFATRGHTATRIADIAQEAGVAYGLVYHYFGSKDALLDTVFDENWATFAEVVEGVAASDRSARDKVRVVLDYALASAETYPERVQVILLEYGRRARLGQALTHAHVARVVATLRALFQGAAARGELAPGAVPEVLPVVLLGALQSVIVAMLVDREPLEAAAVRSTILSLLSVSDASPEE